MFQGKKGVSIYLVIVILSVLTSAILALVGINLSQMKVVLTIGYSLKAFFAADTGIEHALNDRASPEATYSGYLDLNNNSSQDDEHDAFYEVIVNPSGVNCDAANFCIKSVGRYRDIKRAIEVKY